MKKIYFIISISVLSLVSFSQSLNLSPKDVNYDTEKLKLIQSSVQNNTKSILNSQSTTTTNFSCSCLIPRDSSYTIMPPTDDAIWQINLPFTFCLYGINYSTCNIATNGNVQFATNSIAFSATGFPANNVNMIAPFWTDADSRGSGILSYKITGSALIVKWDSIGYYSNHTDKVNTFQLIITDGLDSLVSGGNVSFCYGDMQWTTGDASSGANGFPTGSNIIAATAGINNGDGTYYFQIGRFAAPGLGYNGPYNAIDSVDALDNMQFIYDACSIASNIAPFSTANICDTTIISPFQIVTGEVYIYAPEINQSVTVNYNEQSFKTNTNAFSILSIDTVIGGAIVHYQFDASLAAPGSHIVANITGTDNYIPQQTYSRSLYFKVQELTTGVFEKETFQKPFVFPNPSSKTLYLSNSTETLTLNLYDSIGKMVIEKEFESFDKRLLSIEQLTDGYYFAKIYCNNKLISTQKIIISK